MTTSIGELVGWIVGALAVLAFWNYKSASKKTDDNFKLLFKMQTEHGERTIRTETNLQNQTVQLTKDLSEIKKQCSDTARDVNNIRITMASTNNKVDK